MTVFEVWGFVVVGRQGAVVQQDGEAFGIERIGLVGLAHPLLGLGRIGKMWMMTGPLHFVDHPVPMAGRFESDLATRRKGVQEVDGLRALVRL